MRRLTPANLVLRLKWELRRGIDKVLGSIERTSLRVSDSRNSTRLGHSMIREELLGHLRRQRHSWQNSYTGGYFYQGFEELGLYGAKLTGRRFLQYEVSEILKGARILDIGSNSGFVAIHCARIGQSVVGVELNPHLVAMAQSAAEYLRVPNITFERKDFMEFYSDTKFDVVLSLSNHHTIDGNLDMGFKAYIEKIVDLMNPDGTLLFESHNVFGPGTGIPGDDGDMQVKIGILTDYFVIERFRMVRSFLKYGDIDKLFIVARRSSRPSPIEFDLEKARRTYEWTYPASSVS